MDHFSIAIVDHFSIDIYTLRMDESTLKIYDEDELIREHSIRGKPLNYHRDDYAAILRSDVFKHLEEDELERYVDENLQAYDDL